MAADIGGLFDDDDFEIGGFLFQRYGCRKPGRAGADDHHAGFHNLAFYRIGHQSFPSEVEAQVAV